MQDRGAGHQAMRCFVVDNALYSIMELRYKSMKRNSGYRGDRKARWHRRVVSAMTCRDMESIQVASSATVRIGHRRSRDFI